MYTSTSLASNIHAYKPCPHNTSILTIWHLNVIMEWLWTRNPTRGEWMTRHGSCKPLNHSSWLSIITVRLMDKLWKSWMISHLHGWKIGTDHDNPFAIGQVIGYGYQHCPCRGIWFLSVEHKTHCCKKSKISLQPKYNRQLFLRQHVIAADNVHSIPNLITLVIPLNVRDTVQSYATL